MIEILDEPERGNRPKPGFRPSLAILVTVLVAVVVYGATLPSGPADSSSNGYVVDSDHPGLAEVGWAAIDGPWLADDVADSGAAMVRTDDRIISLQHNIRDLNERNIEKIDLETDDVPTTSDLDTRVKRATIIWLAVA